MYIPPWLQKRYGVNGAKITGKYICESKKLNLFIFTNAPKQNSPPGSYHYPKTDPNYPFLLKNAFLKYIFPQQKRQDYGAEKNDQN